MPGDRDDRRASARASGDGGERAAGERGRDLGAAHHRVGDDGVDAGGLDLGGAVARRPRRSRACRRTRRTRGRRRRTTPRCRAGAMSRSAGPFTGAPPTIGLTATTRSRRATQRVADAGDREDRADRDHRVRRADRRSCRPCAARRARRAPGRAASAPSKRTRHDRRLGALADEPLLHRELLGRAAGRVAP